MGLTRRIARAQRQHVRISQLGTWCVLCDATVGQFGRYHKTSVDGLFVWFYYVCARCEDQHGAGLDAEVEQAIKHHLTVACLSEADKLEGTA